VSDPVLGDASEFCATEQPATFRGYTLAEAVKVAADAQVYPAAALEAARRREGHLTALVASAIDEAEEQSPRGTYIEADEDEIDEMANNGQLTVLAQTMAVEAGADWPGLDGNAQDAWHERAIEHLRSAGQPTETCGRCGAEFPAGESCSGPGYHPLRRRGPDRRGASRHQGACAMIDPTFAHLAPPAADRAATALAEQIAASLREEFAAALPAMTVVNASGLRLTDGGAQIVVTVEASAELMALIEASIAKGTGPG